MAVGEMVSTAYPSQATIAAPRLRVFVRLKLSLTINSFRGHTWKAVGFAFGLVFGVTVAGLAWLGFFGAAVASAEVGYAVAVLGGAALVVGWVFFPLLFFGVDETLDPARFALLPLPRPALMRGILASAFVGTPALATALALTGLIAAAGVRLGPVEAVVAAVGVALGLVLCVVVSRSLTSALARMLRSRRARDLGIVVLAVLGSSVAPLQWALSATFDQADPERTLAHLQRVGEIVGWTPLGAPFVLPYDAAAGQWTAVAAKAGIAAVTIAALVWLWSRSIESAMLDTGSGTAKRAALGVGATAALVPRALRWVRPGPFAAIMAREFRFWWRDPRRRAALVSILMVSVVLPVTFAIGGTGSSSGIQLGGGGLAFAVVLAGSIAGLLLADQFGYDGSAHAAHLLAAVRGRTDIRARGVAIALIAAPVQAAVVVALAVTLGEPMDAPAALGVLAASFGAGVALAALLSVLAPYAVPESTNPFASGSGSAKGLLSLVAAVGNVILCGPVLAAYFLLRSLTAGGLLVGTWLVLLAGVIYGVAAAWLGTGLAGRLLDDRGPEVLRAVTPNR